MFRKGRQKLGNRKRARLAELRSCLLMRTLRTFDSAVNTQGATALPAHSLKFGNNKAHRSIATNVISGALRV